MSTSPGYMIAHVPAFPLPVAVTNNYLIGPPDEGVRHIDFREDGVSVQGLILIPLSRGIRFGDWLSFRHPRLWRALPIRARKAFK